MPLMYEVRLAQSRELVMICPIETLAIFNFTPTQIRQIELGEQPKLFWHLWRIEVTRMPLELPSPPASGRGHFGTSAAEQVLFGMLGRRLLAGEHELTVRLMGELDWARGEIEQLQSILKIKDETIFALQSDVVRYGDENRERE